MQSVVAAGVVTGLLGAAWWWHEYRIGMRRQRERARLVTALGRGLNNQLLLIGTTGSVLNYSARQNLAGPPSELIGCMPAKLNLSDFASGQLVGEFGERLRVLFDYQARLDFVRNVTIAFHEVQSTNGQHALIDNNTLVELWRDLAVQGLACAVALEDLINRPLLPQNADEGPDLQAIMLAVSAGDWPCVQQNGKVVVPGWIEQRSEQRRMLAEDAIVHTARDQSSVKIRDVSAGGLGLEGAVNVHPGDNVSIALASGRRLEGVAVWEQGGKVGVKLHQTVNVDDWPAAGAAPRPATATRTAHGR